MENNKTKFFIIVYNNIIINSVIISPIKGRCFFLFKYIQIQLICLLNIIIIHAVRDLRDESIN